VSIRKKMNMRKINKIWYVICLIALLSLSNTGCPSKSGTEQKEWFRYASEYDQESKKFVEKAIANEYSILVDDLAKSRKIEQKFLRAKQPTETEIISVLRSPNRRFQRVGLVAMSIKPIETEKIIDILFEFLQDQDPEFMWCTVGSLAKFSKFPESRKEDLDVVPIVVGGLLATPFIHSLCHL
jgi:hypothetical protein